jgi:CBS domain-containing protein
MAESINQYYVKDLVIDDEYATVTADTSIKEAALLMKEKGIPDLVVLDENSSVLGVVADYDIVIGAVATGKDVESTKVVESMYKIEPVKLDTPVEVAFNRMQELDVSAIPVVDDNNKLLGIVTITDCWGYLPDKYEDYKGLLTVSNPRFANYWFTVTMTVLYFFFGILSPILGFAGFLNSKLILSSTYNPSVTYYLFDARGGEYFIRYLDIRGDTLPWLLVTIYSIVFIIIGIITTILIIQWAYADYRMLKQGESQWHTIAAVVGIANVVIIWLLFLFLLSIGIARVGEASIDISGLSFSIASIIFLVLAVNRDHFFKQKEKPQNVDTPSITTQEEEN